MDDAVLVVVDVAPAYPFLDFLGWAEGVLIVLNVDVAVAIVDDVVTTVGNGVGCTVSCCVNICVCACVCVWVENLIVSTRIMFNLYTIGL